MPAKIRNQQFEQNINKRGKVRADERRQTERRWDRLSTGGAARWLVALAEWPAHSNVIMRATGAASDIASPCFCFLLPLCPCSGSDREAGEDQQPRSSGDRLLPLRRRRIGSLPDHPNGAVGTIILNFALTAKSHVCRLAHSLPFFTRTRPPPPPAAAAASASRPLPCSPPCCSARRNPLFRNAHLSSSAVSSSSSHASLLSHAALVNRHVQVGGRSLLLLPPLWQLFHCSSFSRLAMCLCMYLGPLASCN